MQNRPITIARLNEVLEYTPSTGKNALTRKQSPRKDNIGIQVGLPRKANRYAAVTVDGVQIPAHVAVWALVYGTWPEHMIDHIDGDGFNNRVENLRLCFNGAKDNGQNRRQRKRRALPTGVTLYGTDTLMRPVYKAQITAFGVTHLLGQFNTAEAAAEAYRTAKAKLHAFNPTTVA